MPELLHILRSHFFEGDLVSDLEFDRVYDARIRAASSQHWTPVHIAARAATLLTRSGSSRILDVGSGVGKFCIVGALSTSAQFVGVERRRRLVDIARHAATGFGAAMRATFVHADITEFSFEGFDGVYLYNPFYEQISTFIDQIDDEIERSPASYRRYVDTTVEKLAAMSAPVTVVTFNGFGGNMPSGYTFLGGEPAGTDRLETWVRR